MKCFRFSTQQKKMVRILGHRTSCSRCRRRTSCRAFCCQWYSKFVKLEDVFHVQNNLKQIGPGHCSVCFSASGGAFPPGRIQKGNFKTVSWSSFFLEFMDHVDRQATWAPVTDADLVTHDTRLFLNADFSFPSKSQSNNNEDTTISLPERFSRRVISSQ